MAHHIEQHFKGLRVQSGRRRRHHHDPFATGFEDDEDDNNSKEKGGDNEEEEPGQQRSRRRSADPQARSSARSTAIVPSAPVSSSALSGGGEKGLLSPSQKSPKTAIALAAGSLAHLDDSNSEEDDREPQTSSRVDRRPSPAPPGPGKTSSPHQWNRRTSTSSARNNEAAKEATPSRHTVASPFAGTKYLEDSDSDEGEAASSRKSSADVTAADITDSAQKDHRCEKKAEKPKTRAPISWLAFSEQRDNAIEAVQSDFRRREKQPPFPVPVPREEAGAPAATNHHRDGQPISLPPLLKSATENDSTSPTRSSSEQDSLQGSPIEINAATRHRPPMMLHLQVLPEATLTSDLPVSPASDSPLIAFPDLKDALLSPDAIGNLTSKVAVLPPQTIPESVAVDHPVTSVALPVVSPAPIELTEPVSRSKRTRSLRAVPELPMKIPSGRRLSRRSATVQSVSPARAFLSSWGSRDTTPLETAREPNPDDEGQAIGLNSEYIIGRTINHGGFGVIKEIHTIDERGVAIVRAVKIVRKTIPGKDNAQNEVAQQELEHEVSVWRHLKHRHILNLQAVYDTEFATFCIMELNVGGTLFDLVRSSRASSGDKDGHKGLEPPLAQSYAFQLACALRYLHEDIRVCHRDVKLENCLIDMTGPDAAIAGGHLRLCDFGLADFLNRDLSVDDSTTELDINLLVSDHGPPPDPRPTTSSIIGTLEYASPKGLSVSRKLFETAGDVWAFGVIVYALCTGELPFRHPMPSKTVDMILQAEWDDGALAHAATGGNEVRELVQGCLEKDIDARLTIGEVLGSRWFDGRYHPEDALDDAWG